MKLGDKVLIGIIILAIFSYFIYNYFANTTSDELIVIIKQNGEVIKQFKITDTMEYQETFKWQGHSNTIKIKNNTVRIIAADCKDKLCINQGEISRQGESIVCLPNRFVVEIKSAKDLGVDYIIK